MHAGTDRQSKIRNAMLAAAPMQTAWPAIAFADFWSWSEGYDFRYSSAPLSTNSRAFSWGSRSRISDLAEQMIRLSGKVPGAEIEIRYTGLRAGEKLFEKLFHDQEALRATKHKKILLARHRHVDSHVLKSTLAEMAEAVARYDEERLQSLLHRLAPEFAIQADERGTATVVPFTPRVG